MPDALYQLRIARIRAEVDKQFALGLASEVPLLKNTCKTWLRDKRGFFTFMSDKRVEPTNNLAERQLRFAVLWRKMMLGTKSREGARFVERMLTVTQTLKACPRALSDFVNAAVVAYIRGTKPPSLVDARARIAA